MVYSYFRKLEKVRVKRWMIIGQMMVKNLDGSLRMNKYWFTGTETKLIDTESKLVNWGRVDYLLSSMIKSTTIVMVTIACCWGIYWILAQTFGSL